MKTAPGRPARIFLVDDHPLMREGLLQCLAQERGLRVCGHTGSAAAALQAIPALKPDLAIVDIALPGRDGLELIKDLRTLYPPCRLLVVSLFDEELYAERALRAGAHGYVMKQEPLEKVIQAVRTVLAGGLFTSAHIAQHALAATLGGPPQPAAPEARLTDRELEVYRRIGTGRSRHRLARELGMSVKTFEAHRYNLRQKLGLASAAEVLLHAAQFLRGQACRTAAEVGLCPMPKTDWHPLGTPRGLEHTTSASPPSAPRRSGRSGVRIARPHRRPPPQRPAPGPSPSAKSLPSGPAQRKLPLGRAGAVRRGARHREKG